MINKTHFALIPLSLLLLNGCSNSDDDEKKSIAATIIAYAEDKGIISNTEGAQLCEDLNLNDACDPDEQTSTLSNSKGEFEFDNELTIGSHVISLKNGSSAGNESSVSLRGIVEEGKALVISPLTTLVSKDLTPPQIVEILQLAGVQNISTSDISLDPLSKFSLEQSSFSNEDIDAMVASISTYTLLRIIAGSEKLSSLKGDELYQSATGQNGHSEVKTIASAMVQYIQKGLSQETFAQIQSAQRIASSSYPFGDLPDINLGDVLNTTLSISHHLSEIGYETCNATNGDFEAALNSVATASNSGANISTWASKLGQMNYAYRIQDEVNGKTFFPQTLQEGFSCDSGHFTITKEGTTSCK
jgi:hypothetical protein